MAFRDELDDLYNSLVDDVADIVDDPPPLLGGAGGSVFELE